MSVLLETSQQAVSITDFTRSAKRYFSDLKDGVQNRFVVMKNNHPEAVMLSIETFESMISEIDDMRMELIAVERLNSLNEDNLISHKDMMKKFEL